MVLGIIVAAVADNIVLLSPLESDTWAAALICGGPILYLLGNAFFVKAIGGPWLLSHFVGILLLGVIFLAHDSLPSLATYWIGNGVLAAVLAADEWGLRRRRRNTDEDVV
jgi:low temperature requirement protein LtrA